MLLSVSSVTIPSFDSFSFAIVLACNVSIWLHLRKHMVPQEVARNKIERQVGNALLAQASANRQWLILLRS